MSETRFYAFIKMLNSQGFLMSSRLAHVLLKDKFIYFNFKKNSRPHLPPSLNPYCHENMS
jgi:hypothetical protein